MTCTPVALLGPLLVAVIVKVTFCPTFGAEPLTDFPIAMSADWPVTDADALLLPLLGSNWFSAVLVAVLVTVEVPVAVAVTCSVARAPFASEPMLQTPVAGV